MPLDNPGFGLGDGGQLRTPIAGIFLGHCQLLAHSVKYGTLMFNTIPLPLTYTAGKAGAINFATYCHYVKLGCRSDLDTKGPSSYRG